MSNDTRKLSPKVLSYRNKVKAKFDYLANIEVKRDNFQDLLQASQKLKELYREAFQLEKSSAAEKEFIYLAYFDYIVELNWVAVYLKVFHKLHELCPNAFIGHTHPDEKFEPYPPKLDVRKQTLVHATAVVWLNLNGTVLSYTDLQEKSMELAGSEGLLKYYVIDFLPKVMSGDPPESTARGKMLQMGLTTFYNLTRASANQVFFEEYDAVNILLKLRRTSKGRNNMLVLCGLAYLIKEENNHLIISGKAPIDILFKYMNSAMQQQNRRCHGFTVSELCDCLAQIAVNDSNKKLIADSGGIAVFTKVLKEAKDDMERISACKALWMLAFHDKNKDAIRNADEILDILVSLQASDNSELRMSAAGVIWELQGKGAAIEANLKNVETDNSNAGHIMISYQWDVQATAIKVRDRLKQCGFQTWMDIDKMGGSILQSMASAVEKSQLVLMCVSRKYKDSPNCRSEAEYAFQLHKPVIPLMMENNFQPDGWLGFILGSKFWIDFKDKKNIFESIGKLLKELKNQRMIVEEKIVDSVEKNVSSVDVDIPDGAASAKDKILKWTLNEVQSWLSDNEILGSLNHDIVNDLTGKNLVLLQQLRMESPEVFHNSIRADFGFKNILAQLKFVDALQKLVGNP